MPTLWVHTLSAVLDLGTILQHTGILPEQYFQILGWLPCFDLAIN